MIDLETIKKNITNDELLIENDTYVKAFTNINVFINYYLSLSESTKYITRNNRMLMVLNEDWIGDNVEITSVIENDFIQYSQFKINNFVCRLENDGRLTPLIPKPSGAKRHEWEENLYTCNEIEINYENMRDATIEYCEYMKDKIIKSRINEFGSIEVYNSIMNCKKKIEDICCEICFCEEQDMVDDKEIDALIKQKQKLEQYLDIAVEEKIMVEDVVKRCFNINNIKNKLGDGINE